MRGSINHTPRPLSTADACSRLRERTRMWRVAEVHFPMLYAMLIPSAEGERHDRMPVLCPRCHTDQVMNASKTIVHLCNTTDLRKDPGSRTPSPRLSYGIGSRNGVSSSLTYTITIRNDTVRLRLYPILFT
jgi:hypothetical protein